MAEINNTILDRYIALADRIAKNNADIDDLRSIFANDALINLDGIDVEGIDAILEYYRRFFDQLAETTHYWNTIVLTEHSLEAEWVAASRLKNGRVVIMKGIETAQLNSNGLISRLHNRLVIPVS